MPTPRLLIFDLDGTLIDSSTDICNAVNATLAHLHRPELPDAVIASYTGGGAAMLLRRALGDSGDLDSFPVDDTALHEALSYFIRYYRVHKLDNTVLYEGVLEALDEFRRVQPAILMAVLTNKPVGPSREICRMLGIARHFFQNYGGDSFPTKKPEPQGFLKLTEEADALLIVRGDTPLHPDEIIMIGDSAVDVLTARSCGSRTIGCAFGINPQQLLAAQPDILVNHASEWLTALRELTSG